MSIDPEFWHGRWRDGNTPWHRPFPNERLDTHFGHLDVPDGGQVFVPLCGKAVDMAWLAARGWQVLGVELSPVAVRDFFAEQGIAASESIDGPFHARAGGGVRLLCGDFFAYPATFVFPHAIVGAGCAGKASQRFPIPPIAAACGKAICAQWLVVCPGRETNGFGLSNAVEFKIVD